MAETKIQQWKRKIAHKRRKHEEKEMMKTWDVISKKQSTIRHIDFEAGYFYAPYIPVMQFRDEAQQKIIEAMAVPKHLLGSKHGFNR